MASQASAAPGADESGRRKLRLAASLQINSAPSPWRPSASLAPDTPGPPVAPEAEEAQEERGPQASTTVAVAAGDSGLGTGAGRECGAGQVGDDTGTRLGTPPKVPVPPAGPAGDLPKVAGQLRLLPEDPPPGQAVALLEQYAAGLGVALTFREDPTAGEMGPRPAGELLTPGHTGEGWGAGPKPGVSRETLRLQSPPDIC